MRRLIPLVLLLGCTSAAPDTTVVRAITETGLVAAWGFDEASGTTSTDATCNGHTATLSGQTHVTGKFGNALSFSSNMATVADAPDLRMTTAVTVEAWVKPHYQDYNFFGVVAKERSSGYSYALYSNTNTAWPRGAVYTGSAKVVNGWFGLTTETWTHLAVTYDKVRVRLYVNGTEVGNLASTQSITTSTNPLRIGRGLAGEWFQGSIDEVRIYNRALSASEIATNKDQPIGSAACGGTGGAGGSGGAGGIGGGGSGGSSAGAGAGGGGASGAGGSSAGAGGSDVAGAAGGGASGSGGGSAGVGVDAGTGGVAQDGGVDAAGGTGGGTDAGCSGLYPVKLATGAHYLTDHCDRPYLMVGDSPWDLIVSVSTTDAITYLDDRHARGFTTVLVELIEHFFQPNPPRNFAGDLPFTGTLAGGARDFTTPNEAYFAHADEIINAAAARGILVQLVPDYLGFEDTQEGWYDEMVANGTTRLTTYGTYVGNRYKDFPNILWVEGADRNPANSSIPSAVATAILAADSNHLHTAHMLRGTSALDYWTTASWLGVDSVYVDPLTTPVYQAAQSAYTRSGWKPFFLIEARYEGEGGSYTALLGRQQSYEAVLNGGMGANFGNSPVWSFSTGWQAALDTQGSRDTGRLATLFSSRHWEQLVPDVGHAFLTAGFSSGSVFASAAVTADGKLGMVYTPAVRNLTVDMTKMSGSTTARWFDPTSGSFTTVSGSPFANSGSHVFNPGGTNGAGAADWVLVLETT